MTAPLPCQASALPEALTHARPRLHELLSGPATALSGLPWTPGVRRHATLSDLIRALAGGWDPNAKVLVDPWAVPCGLPEDAESWPTPERACSWLGVAHTSRLPCLTRPRTSHAEPLDELLAGPCPDRPAIGYARHWGTYDDTAKAPWLELSALDVREGPAGLSSLLAVTTTWRRDGPDHVESAPTVGRDGILLLTASAGLGRAPSAAALTYLVPADHHHTGRRALAHLQRWRTALFTSLLGDVPAGVAESGANPCGLVIYDMVDTINRW